MLSRLDKSPIRQALAVGLVTLGVAGCGGDKSDQTKAAATCLGNALANEALHGGTDCGNGTAAHVLDQGSGTRVTVACTHRDGNEYICDVKVPESNGIRLTSVRPGFYDVTYDGKSIVFQQTQ